MALDQDLTPSAAEPAPNTGLDYQLPTYRAISPSAIISLICGVLAVFSFTSLYFLAFTAAAFVLGMRAERKIARDPLIWTGRKMAQAGIGLGMVFGLAAFTTNFVQDFLLTRAAGQFASAYADVLKKGTIEDAAWYTVTPPAREGKKPVEVYKEMTAQGAGGPMPNDQLAAPRAIQERLKSDPGQVLVFKRIEGHGLDGMNPYASAIYELSGPASKTYPETQLAYLFLKGTVSKGKLHWWVESSKFPYDPSPVGRRQ